MLRQAWSSTTIRAIRSTAIPKLPARRMLTCFLVTIHLAATVQAAIDVKSDGSDGLLDPSVDDSMCLGGLQSGVCEIDLGQAIEGTWSQDNTANAGKGVYDTSKWAVVFKYSSVNIAPGVTIRFRNNLSRAPVVWLVDGSVMIDGTVNLDGELRTGSSRMAEPGPGGFRGAAASVAGGSAASPGFGPGGGQRGDRGGSYASLGGQGSGPTYGNDRVLPLIGGSGGGAEAAGGAAGGGAILIAANDGITMNGLIQANGGRGGDFRNGGAGSGGAVRFVADQIQGTGSIRAVGGASSDRSVGGAGRVRLEALQPITLTDINPAETTGVPCTTPGQDCPAVIWPEDALENVPSVRITQVANNDVGPNPGGRFEFPIHDVQFADPNEVTVVIAAEFVPASGWDVVVRMTPRSGDYTEVCAVETSRAGDSSTWEAGLTFPNGFSSIQVRASQGINCP